MAAKTHNNSKKHPGLTGTTGISTRSDAGSGHSKQAVDKKGK